MEIPYVVTARPDTGLWNAKLGIWLFLASEVMLFGGLFASYLFLRLDADYPWPVHVLTVEWGFLNTLVLIFSSVTVLQAWLALKMRKYRRFQIWQSITILCALGFLVIKSIEYYDKFHHYGVRLQDGSVLEGHLKSGYDVKFTAEKAITLAGKTQEEGTFRLPGMRDGITFGGQGSDANFLKYVEGGEIQAEADGTAIKLDATKVKEIVGKAWNDGKQEVELKITAPVKMAISPSALALYDKDKAVFKDGTTIVGHLDDDRMELTADKVDLRRLINKDEPTPEAAVEGMESADAWRVLGGNWKEKFIEHYKAELEKFHKDHPSQHPLENSDFVRETFTMSLEPKEEKAEKPVAEHAGAGDKAEKTAPPAGAGEQAGAEPGEPKIKIERKDIAFYSNFTPKYNTYFAIYFALTGLHGLHVLAGAIVLTYMLIFGKQLYLASPEHMSNRVETAGLFWHFVDLIWIFLFPLLYLM